jgi:hypothetical protein
MRTKTECEKRKKLYRLISVIFILVGAVRLTMAVLNHDHSAAAVGPQFEAAALWLCLGAAWVALSRIWGEFADTSTN